jgi:hypothetical protein
MAKVKTINLQGKEYAQVSDRIKQFREDCPNGLIETDFKQEDGQIIFTARIVKDKAKPESAEATGHALGSIKGQKAFEKLETIAVGRALAMLGYMGSGEIASSDEMEEFYTYRENQIQEAIDQLEQASDLEELKRTFLSLGNQMADKKVIATKDAKKEQLNANN